MINPGMHHRIVLLLILSLSLLQAISAQERFRYNPGAEQMFVRALARFHDGDFERSAALFDSLVNLSPAHQRTTAAFVMSAKSLFQIKRYAASQGILRDFLSRFPESSYGPDAYFVLGLNSMMLQAYDDAVRMFRKARSIAADSSLKRESLSYIDLIGSERLDVAALGKLVRETDDRDVRDLLAIILGEKYRAAGDASRVNEALSSVSKGAHPPAIEKRISQLRQSIAANTSMRIGVLLPSGGSSSSGGSSALANEVFEGIQQAVDEFKGSSHHGTNVALQIKYLNGDASSASVVQELAASPDVVSIVGPLYSSQALALAPAAESGGIPMLSPTANANGIAAKSRYVFQMNPDASTRGKAMARYAVHDLGMKKLAVISSVNVQSKVLADEFAREVRLLGGEIAAFETYNTDSTDLREQFMKIREAAASGEPSVSFTGRFSRKQVKSMERAGADHDLLAEARRSRKSVPVTRLFGPRGKVIADSLHIPLVVSLGETFNLEVPVTGIQGMFASIGASEEIGVIASQMSYFNVNAQLLGSGEWYDPALLEANKLYVDGMIFLSDNFVAPDDSSYAAFEQSFLRSRKKSPTRNTLYGYDTMNLLLRYIEGGATTRQKLASALQHEKGYRGIHGTITLDPGRVNSNVHILKFRNNGIVNVAEIHVE